MIGKVRVGRLALTGALVVMVAGCGGSASSPAASTGGGASPAPAASSGGAASPAASSGGSEATPAASSGGVSGDAIAALSDLTSYKIKLVLAAKGTTSGMGALGNVTMEGTVVLKPEKASDITTMGIRMVEVGGKQYIDMGSGLIESTDAGQTSMADSLAPEKLLGGMTSYLSQMKSVGDEQKNGIATVHYQADEKVLGEAAAALSMMGLTDAKWNWDVWIAKQGGYAVSYILKGTGTDGASFSISLDISDVNSPSNVVKGP